MELLNTVEYRKLRLKILQRDDYQCQKCGIRGKSGIRSKLQVDHIKSRMIFPEFSMDENNLRTLCLDCHKQTESFLNRWQTSRYCDVIIARWEQFTNKKAIKL